MIRHIKAFINSWRSDHTTPDLKSIVEALPIVFMLGLFIICFMWFDMQNRFTRMGTEILSNQRRIRAAQLSADAADKSAAEATRHIHDTLLLAEERSRKIERILALSQKLLARSKANQESIIASESSLRESARHLEALKNSSTANLKQTQEVGAQVDQGTSRILDTYTINHQNIERHLTLQGKAILEIQKAVSDLALSQRKNSQRLDELNSKLEKLRIAHR